MPDTLCKCGCGGSVYAASKTGFLRGHHMRGELALVPTEAVVVDAPDQAAIDLLDQTTLDPLDCPYTVEVTPRQIERLWSMLPDGERISAALAALTIDRSQS